MSSSPRSTTIAGDTAALKHNSYAWSVADILIATVLAVASGFVFVAYNGPGGALYEAVASVLPGLGGLAVGPWLFAGPLVGLIIRKPGAALFGEVIAASVSAAVGSQWGIGVLWSGIAQGLGAEIVLAIFIYRRWNLAVTALAGAGAGVGAWVLEFFQGNIAKSVEFNVTYFVTLIISGAVIAGLLVFVIVRALAATGSLDKVAAGRANRTVV